MLCFSFVLHYMFIPLSFIIFGHPVSYSYVIQDLHRLIHNLPISIITLQETHVTSCTDITAFHLPDYTFVFDLARLNNFGGVALYVHYSFTFSWLPIDKYNQNSDVYESIYIEIFHKKSKFNKFIIGNIYRRPLTMAEHVSTFITEFSETLNTAHERSKKAYISGDLNIDILKFHMNSTFNTCFENVTS